MPATPVAWNHDLIVNPRRTGVQREPAVTQLANGNILVCWTDENDSGPGSPPLSDIMGRIFDPAGKVVSGEFRLNQFSTGSAEYDPNILATPDGGFVLNYADPQDLTSNNHQPKSFNFNSLYERFDANGNHVSGGFVFDDQDSSNSNQIIATEDTSQIASASNSTRIMNAYVAHDEPGILPLQRVGTVIVRSYDIEQSQFGNFQEAMTFTEENPPLFVFVFDIVTDVSIASLSNGKFALAASVSTVFGEGKIAIQMLNGNGSKHGSLIKFDLVNFPDEVATIGLVNGGLVVMWSDGPDSPTIQKFRIYDNEGSLVLGTQDLGEDGGMSQNCIAALPDGGFVIASGNSFQRFDATGEKVGVAVNFAPAGVDKPSVSVLADGRFSLTWSDGDIHTQIFDPRDSVNTTPVNYGGDGWQVGTAGDDAFAAALTADVVHGGAGNDTITSAGPRQADHLQRAIFGDGGDDLLVAGPVITGTDYRPDTFDGGSGNDRLSFQGFTALGVTADLALGFWRLQFTSNIGLANIENLTGGSRGDTLTGNGSANKLNGGGGVDILSGGGGIDTLDGGAGADTMRGGTQSDVYLVDDALDRVIEGSGVNDGGGDEIFSRVTYTLPDNVEALTLTGNRNINGTGRDEETDLIVGNDGNNLLSGLGGNDKLVGGRGHDTLLGGDDDDTLNGGEGNDTLDGGAGIDELNGDAGQDIATYVNSILSINLALDGSFAATGDAAADDLSSIEGIAGGNAVDGLRGDGNANILIGNGGRDTLEGMANNDVLTGGAGRDTLIGGAGADVFDYNALSESTFDPQNRDDISDFEANSVDLIDLSTLDANETTGTVNDQFTFMGNAGFTGLGQIRVFQNAIDTFVDINSTGDTTVDMRIRIRGLHTLDAADFVL